MNAIKLNVAFAMTGVATTLLGPMMPLIEPRWRIGDAEAGLLFTAQFLASVLGAAALGPLARRLGYSALVVGGLAFVAAGMAGCAFANWPLVLVSVAGYGLGLGFAIPAGNLIAAAGPRGARAVVWLNFSWCLGAVAGPALTAACGMAAWKIVAAASAVCAWLIAVERTPVPARARGLPTRENYAISRVALLAGLFLFLYVAAEQALSAWLASLALRSHATARFWAAAPSIFWAGVLTARAITPWLLNRRLPRALVYAGLAIAAAGVAALIQARTAALALAAGAICGIGLAPVYPLVVAQYAAARRNGGGPSGVVFAAGGLGGAAGPLAIGYISQTTGSLRTGLACALPVIAVMAWLQLGLARSKETQESAK